MLSRTNGSVYISNADWIHVGKYCQITYTIRPTQVKNIAMIPDDFFQNAATLQPLMHPLSLDYITT